MDKYEFSDGKFEIIPVPYLKDNLAYIVIHKATSDFLLVDPADYEMTQKLLKLHNLHKPPTAILCTHRHWDSSGHN